MAANPNNTDRLCMRAGVRGQRSKSIRHNPNARRLLPSDKMAPENTNNFECCMAKIAAIKNVLSPISEMIMTHSEAMNP